MHNRGFFHHALLGHIGLFLMLVIARLASRAYSDQQTVGGRLSGFFARRTIDVIAGVGWLADRLPQPAPRAACMPVDTARRRPAVEPLRARRYRLVFR